MNRNAGGCSTDTSLQSISKHFSFGSNGKQVEIQIVSGVEMAATKALQQIVIVCHGHERNAALIHSQATSASVDRKSTLIVAPQFYNSSDKDRYRADGCDEEKLLVWKGNGWAEGKASLAPKGLQLSSFEVLDALVLHYSNRQRYTGLQRIVIAGHSLGGQFVQRYSVLNNSRVDIRVSYVVMNPSTYLYPDLQYEYKYGLRGIQSTLSSYPAALQPASQLCERMRTREMHFLLGMRDKGVGDDRHEAMKQGADRQERFNNWKRYVQRYSLDVNMTFDEVPGVGHDAGQMMSSSQGRRHIFLP